MRGFEEVVESYQRRVYTFAYYFLGRPQEAEDVTQEVFLKLWRHWSKIDPERLEAWLMRVTRNASYDLLRRRRTAGQVVLEPADEATVERAEAGGPDPAQRAENRDFRRLLRAAVARVAEPYRSVLVLREIQGLKYREIAAALETPLNTVRVYLHRGRRKLREELREVYPDE